MWGPTHASVLLSRRPNKLTAGHVSVTPVVPAGCPRCPRGGIRLQRAWGAGWCHCSASLAPAQQGERASRVRYFLSILRKTKPRDKNEPKPLPLPAFQPCLVFRFGKRSCGRLVSKAQLPDIGKREKQANIWKELENFRTNSGTCGRAQRSFLPSLPRLVLLK